MGRIDINLSFPSSQEPSQLDQQSPVKLTATHVASSEHVEDVSISDKVDATQNYPFRPRVRREDLRFVDASEVAKRDGIGLNRLWIVVDDIVLDCTEFKRKHPAGKSIIEGFGGHDCTWQWWSFHSQQIMQKYGNSLRVARTSNVPNKFDRPVRRNIELPTAGEQW
ncbi:uncharacterized protein AB675_6174 [Cyphellophora attinorum]|uniref:Cytochrome b5 heme-binding domain-containing protein n=1 Tax=Cyphellophora attinorum TaxID=1664694 RepID=A0A0N1HZ41_9EURO|nr:uncharacterized protein AB675_6174 [Phialophora attinorum]KPI43945.1 hypothetical protein AB675_6174 [Phialophora attinorum]